MCLEMHFYEMDIICIQVGTWYTVESTLEVYW